MMPSATRTYMGKGMHVRVRACVRVYVCVYVSLLVLKVTQRVRKGTHFACPHNLALAACGRTPI